MESRVEHPTGMGPPAKVTLSSGPQDGAAWREVTCCFFPLCLGYQPTSPQVPRAHIFKAWTVLCVTL